MAPILATCSFVRPSPVLNSTSSGRIPSLCTSAFFSFTPAGSSSFHETCQGNWRLPLHRYSQQPSALVQFFPVTSPVLRLSPSHSQRLHRVARKCSFLAGSKKGLRLLGSYGAACSRLSSASGNAVAVATTGGTTSAKELPKPFELRLSERAAFLEASKEGNLVPVFRRIFSDQLTPVSAYRCLVSQDERDAPSFLFESVEHATNGSKVGRFSMLGAQPALEILAKEFTVTILNHEEGCREERVVDDPMNAPSEIADQWKPVMVEGLPDVFCGGWVGYFSYDTMRYVEKKKVPFSHAPTDDRGLPDIHLGLYKDVVIFDHVSKVVYAIHWVEIDKFHSAESAYDDGKVQLSRLVDRLQKGLGSKLAPGTVDLKIGHYWDNNQVSNMTAEEYKTNVMKAKEHILAGDIFQIVLSQRFERRTFADPFEVYRALRVVNPSPYMIYLQARGSIMVGASPEVLTRIQKGKVVNRPLAGTRRRGKTMEDDLELEADLRKDEKEVAEHVMLVDLGRNDVGKVCKPGSVRVERLMDVERYSHVMHISSTVTGELLDDMKSWDALRAALPVGTVSGAPKVRAMELIDEFEPTRRGPYSGGIGHVSFHGDMDIALVLRTMIFPTFDRYNTIYSYKTQNSRREWRVFLQAGAGIVAESDPESEHRECINKAAGLARAIDLAESAFVEH